MKINKINSIEPSKNALTSVLTNIAKPPKELYVAGTLPPERPICVAVIGTRKPSNYGREVAHQFAYNLARLGIYVISGLALGTDTIAHKAALDAGGKTIAVLANGLHRIYPASHESVAKEIVRDGGAIVSEYKIGEEARRHYFLERNRLISGLSDAIVVIEATERSGTLSTVNHAIEQNKEVFAVPGPITSLLSVGPNRLLQQGAHPATSIQDILEVIAPEKIAVNKAAPTSMTLSEAAIIKLMQEGVRGGDELLVRSGMNTSDFLQALTDLEINGAIRPLGGNNWALR